MVTFNWPVRVYIEDTDAGGIVYYVNYLKFMERARTELLRSRGFDKAWILEQEHMFVVKRMNADYLKPAVLDDDLRVSAAIIGSGRAWLDFVQQVCRGDEPLCHAEVRVVCVKKATMKPAAMPPELRQALSC